MALKHIIPILRLDRKAIKAAAKKTENKAALVLVASAGIVLALVMGLISYFTGEFADLPGGAVALVLALFVVLTPLLLLGWYAVLAGIYRGLSWMLGGKGSFGQLFRAVGHAQPPLQLLSVVPYVSILTFIWSQVVDVVIVREIERLSLWRSIVVVIVPLIVFVALLVVAILTMGLLVLSAPGGL